MDRRKVLKEQYKQRKPEMGVIAVKASFAPQVYLEVAKDTKAVINKTIFQLKGGMHRDKGLQQAWKTYGEDKFTVEVLDTLDYNTDETKQDYTEELEELKLILQDKLTNEGFAIY